ncbi:Zn-ribbon domain-containing OB-fold protein [Aquisalimonas lutea]|uniref:Zn-ribbon domain-containing OB-fold protein n=1 Tax=Aquisalimonas lutea TaxID=1327750 RepID=UPI0025B3B1F9|nr:Zn-ribbon domain-containing OB-fold protein [Aquisalimonas lutea]MDN3516540.1 Zn-ribbon domain-containing OB-fold protein [Aquisalimonas lutea]
MATPDEPRSMPAPEINPGDEAYFAAANEGRLLIKRCTACGETHFYPRAVCPFCLGGETVWEESAGRGSVYTFSVTRRAGPTPYAIAFVTLDEGVSMMTNIVDCDLDDIHVGQRVRVVFRDTDGEYRVPCFAPE